MITEAQEKAYKRMAVAATQTEARTEVGRIIIQMFKNSNNLWATAAEILDACSAYDKKLVSNRITYLTANHTFEVDKSGGQKAYKYRLAQRPEEFVGPMMPPPEPQPSIAMETPTVQEIPNTVEVQEIPEGVNGRKSKVVWSDEERLVLAHEVATIREQQKFINLGTALEMAQRSCLPPDRHRIPIAHVKSQAPWLVDMVDLIAKNRPTLPEPMVAEPAPAPVTLEDYSVGQLIDALLDKLGDRLKRNVMEIITSPEVRQMLQPTQIDRSPVIKHNPLGVPMEPTVKRLRVVIAGLLKPTQIEEVKAKFGSSLDLRLYHPDESVHKLKGMVPNADHVILMANMVSHKHEDSLKSTNVKYEKIRGGIDVLLARLRELNAVH